MSKESNGEIILATLEIKLSFSDKEKYEKLKDNIELLKEIGILGFDNHCILDEEIYDVNITKEEIVDDELDYAI